MTVVASPAVATPALSPEQAVARLWADDAVRVHAVLMGRAIPDLPARLAAAVRAREIDDYDCLVPGALPGPAQQQAPHVAVLLRESPFTRWLLLEAAAGFGDWGVLVTAEVRLSALRSHLRSLLDARLPDGGTLRLAWMDPAILQAILPLFDAAALPGFMGPMRTIAIPGREAWTWAQVQQGRLALTTTTVAKAPG